MKLYYTCSIRPEDVQTRTIRPEDVQTITIRPEDVQTITREIIICGMWGSLFD